MMISLIMLLSCCYIRVKFRARLRALLALSALAPPTLVAEVVASDKDGWEAQGQGKGLSLLSDLRRCVRDCTTLDSRLWRGACRRVCVRSQPVFFLDERERPSTKSIVTFNYGWKSRAFLVCLEVFLPSSRSRFWPPPSCCAW